MRTLRRSPLYFPLAVLASLASLTVYAMTPPGQASLSSPSKKSLPVPPDKDSATLSGEYSWGIGVGDFLTLFRNGSFVCRSWGCQGDYGRCAGYWKREGNRIKFQVKFVSGDFVSKPLGDLFIVQEKGKVFLMSESNKADFDKDGTTSVLGFRKSPNPLP